MKIISNFSDYYDGCAFYCAEDIVYNRQLDNGKNVNEYKYAGITYKKDEELIEKLNEIFKSYYSNIFLYNDKLYNSSFLSYKKSIAYIGEKIIPFVIMDSRDENIEREIFFNKEDVWESFNKNVKSFSFYKRNINNFFDLKTHKDCFNKIREISKDPIIIFANNNSSVNCSLKDLGFSKVIEPYEVLQELELFINKINTQEKEVDFDNKIKIKNAGFDDKSFKSNK